MVALRESEEIKVFFQELRVAIGCSLFKEVGPESIRYDFSISIIIEVRESSDDEIMLYCYCRGSEMVFSWEINAKLRVPLAIHLNKFKGQSIDEALRAEFDCEILTSN